MDFDFDSPAGGVMTDEVGAVTGPLSAWVERRGDVSVVLVSYRGSVDRYTVAGGPVAGEVSLERVREVLTREPGLDEAGNARAVDLHAMG